MSIEKSSTSIYFSFGTHPMDSGQSAKLRTIVEGQMRSFYTNSARRRIYIEESNDLLKSQVANINDLYPRYHSYLDAYLAFMIFMKYQQYPTPEDLIDNRRHFLENIQGRGSFAFHELLAIDNLASEVGNIEYQPETHSPREAATFMKADQYIEENLNQAITTTATSGGVDQSLNHYINFLIVEAKLCRTRNRGYRKRVLSIIQESEDSSKAVEIFIRIGAGHDTLIPLITQACHDSKLAVASIKQSTDWGTSDRSPEHRLIAELEIQQTKPDRELCLRVLVSGITERYLIAQGTPESEAISYANLIFQKTTPQNAREFIKGLPYLDFFSLVNRILS